MSDISHQEIERRIHAYDAESKMISERALARAVMDERVQPAFFKTRKNMTTMDKTQLVEIASRQAIELKQSAK